MTATRETVVLIHGLGRSRISMWPLEWRLREAGYRTLNFPYVTWNRSLDEITDDFAAFVRRGVDGERYHLIGHSLGAIVIRNAMARDLPPGLGRIVMLGPPNRPALLA